VKGTLLGLGLDSVDIPRFAEVLGRRPALADRLFTPGEQRYARGLANPVPSLAARFAAKEAVMKALGVGLGAFGWSDVEVLPAGEGGPGLAVTGRAALLAAERGVGAWHLSITHTDTVASAVVAAVA
jgi:holo-[acyl-carrier protein] synthase